MNLGVSKTKTRKIALYSASPLYSFPILEGQEVNGFSLKKKKSPGSCFKHYGTIVTSKKY